MDQLQHYNKVQRKSLQVSVRTKAEKLAYAREVLIEASETEGHTYCVANIYARNKEDIVLLTTSDHNVALQAVENTSHIILWHTLECLLYTPAEETLTVTEAKI